MKHLPCALLLLATLAASSSCSTTRGFGQDLQKVGNRLESQADETGGAVPDRSTAPPRTMPTEY